MKKIYSPKEVYEAVSKGDLALTEQILSNDADLLNLITPLGSWLHIATHHNHKNLVKLLLNLGLDVNIKGGPSGATSLNKAAYSGDIAIFDMLLENGAEFDLSEPDRNPLFSAIHGGHINIVSKLISEGIDLSVKYSGQTMNEMDALGFCHEWGRTEIAELIQGTNGVKTNGVAP